MNDSLLHRAIEVEAWIEDHMVDDHGVVYTFVDRTTGKPLTNEVVETVDPIRLKVGSTAGWWKYENNTMVTAAYMQGLLYRYEADGDILAMARARRCFEALRYIYERGKELEEGFMPKLYDDLFTEETSSDQVLFAILALDHFHEHASEPEKAQASRMITEMTRFFVKRDYKYTYFHMEDMQWPLPRFTFNNLAAYKHSGETLFKKEYERLLALRVNEHPGEEQVRPKLNGEHEPTQLEKEEGGWLLTYPTNTAQMDLSELDFLLQNDPENEWVTRWKRSVISMWNEGAIAVSDDGWAYSALIMDFDTGELRPIESRYLPRDDDDGTHLDNVGAPDADQWAFFPFMTYIHSAKVSYSVLLARSGIAASRHFPREVTIRPMARRILKAFDIHNMTYYLDPDRLAPKFKYMTNLIAGDTVTHWLWGYWQGRGLGVFSESE